MGGAGHFSQSVADNWILSVSSSFVDGRFTCSSAEEHRRC